jgi:metal-responsive CopG/Arc/MetJ family transcriptional regulator
METKGKAIAVYADDSFLVPLDAYAKKEEISRSMAIRQIVMDFLSKEGAAHD